MFPKQSLFHHTCDVLLVNLFKFFIFFLLFSYFREGYSDILYNPTHFHGPFVCRIRQVPLCIGLCLTVMLESLSRSFTSIIFLNTCCFITRIVICVLICSIELFIRVSSVTRFLSSAYIKLHFE